MNIRRRHPATLLFLVAVDVRDIDFWSVRGSLFRSRQPPRPGSKEPLRPIAQWLGIAEPRFERLEGVQGGTGDTRSPHEASGGRTFHRRGKRGFNDLLRRAANHKQPFRIGGLDDPQRR